MSTCNACSGNCSSCGGCAKELVLTQAEIDMLFELAQIPFLPVARKADDMTPVYLEDCAKTPEEYSLVLACLEKKGLVDMDYRQRLSGFDYSQYAAYPIQGSMALTARGQSVVELLELHGTSAEADF